MKQKAFTLIELMVTVAVLSIVAAIAIPSWQAVTRSNRLVNQTNSLVGALNYARSEAIKGGRDITVCPPNLARDACQAGGNWADGWLVVVPCSPSPCTPLVLRAWEPLSGNSTLTADDDGVTYQARGSAAAPVVFTLKPSGCSGEEQRKIEVHGVGRVSTDRETCS